MGAAYRPMTAVAGDFYDFVAVDQKRLGCLVADVSGHGVPAALIASMIKVAMQSSVPCAGPASGAVRVEPCPVRATAGSVHLGGLFVA